MFKLLKCALLSIGVIAGILCLLIVLMRPSHYWTVVRGGSWTSGGRTFTFATAQDLLKAPPDFPIACDALVDPPNHPDGTVNVLSMDGQVRSLDAREFAKSHPDFLGPTEWVAPEGPY